MRSSDSRCGSRSFASLGCSVGSVVLLVVDKAVLLLLMCFVVPLLPAVVIFCSALAILCCVSFLLRFHFLFDFQLLLSTALFFFGWFVLLLFLVCGTKRKKRMYVCMSARALELCMGSAGNGTQTQRRDEKYNLFYNSFFVKHFSAYTSVRWHTQRVSDWFAGCAAGLL